MEPLFCCQKLFVGNYSSLFTFVRLEELLTVDQSLLRISIAIFWLVLRKSVKNFQLFPKG
jgi:hypothetical protein